MLVMRFPQFPKVAMQSLCAAGLSKNEINNLIYMFLRYGFKFDGRYHDEPNNEEIAHVIVAVGSQVSRARLIDETVKFVIKKHGLDYLKQYGVSLSDVITQLGTIYNEFLMLPYSLRNDLGEDVDANEFLDKN